MRRFREGDDGAFELLFERHASAVNGFLRKLTGDSATAEDLTQTTFTSLIRSKDRFVDGMKLTPWLFQVAANAARGLHRHRKVRERADQADVAAEPIVYQPGFDPGLEREVSQAIDQLPPAQRDAVLMHKVQGLSFDEIAEAMGVSSTAARIKAHRGYAKLRELLAHLRD